MGTIGRPILCPESGGRPSEVDGRPIVLDSEGLADCVCAPPGPPLYYKLTPCVCSGGLTRFWSDRYNPDWGCVWAKIDGKCYYICPTSESRETLPPLGVNQRPEFTAADSAEEACTACCDTLPADLCCPQNSLGCGYTRSSNPYVDLVANYSAAVSGEWVDDCDLDGDCETYTYTDTFSGSKKIVGSDIANCFYGFFSDTDQTLTERFFPCEQFNKSTWYNIFGLDGYYSLDDSAGGLSADQAPGYNNGTHAVFGTAQTVTGVILSGVATFSAGFFAYTMGGTLRLAVSKTTGDWWCELDANAMWPNGSGTPTLTAIIQPSSSNDCAPVIGLTFYFQLSQPGLCNGNPSKPVTAVTTLSGQVSFNFPGIGTCPGGGSAPILMFSLDRASGRTGEKMVLDSTPRGTISKLVHPDYRKARRLIHSMRQDADRAKRLISDEDFEAQRRAMIERQRMIEKYNSRDPLRRGGCCGE